MTTRWLPVLLCAALAPTPARLSAQTTAQATRYVLKGDSVAVRGARVKVGTGSGNITLTGAAAPELSVETGSGDVDVTDAQGDNLAIESGSGNVDVALTATFQSLTIETGSGDVTLKVPPTINAEVELDTGSGDIDLGGLSLQVRRIQHDHVTGTIGDGRGRLSIETGSGNVHLVKS